MPLFGFDAKRNSNLQEDTEQVNTTNILGNAKTLGKRTPNGSNLELKVKRREQTATIAKIIDGMKHLLPTI
jgi:hypothetical protein